MALHLNTVIMRRSCIYQDGQSKYTMPPNEVGNDINKLHMITLCTELDQLCYIPPLQPEPTSNVHPVSRPGSAAELQSDVQLVMLPQPSPADVPDSYSLTSFQQLPALFDACNPASPAASPPTDIPIIRPMSSTQASPSPATYVHIGYPMSPVQLPSTVGNMSNPATPTTSPPTDVSIDHPMSSVLTLPTYGDASQPALPIPSPPTYVPISNQILSVQPSATDGNMSNLATALVSASTSLPVQASTQPLKIQDQPPSGLHNSVVFAAMKSTSVKRKAPRLNKIAVRRLNNWFDCHRDHPYPDEDTTLRLAMSGNITTSQVRQWFVNKRRRTRP